MRFQWVKTAALGAAATLCSLTASADMLLNENFEYNAGGLYQQGDWLRHSKNSNEPIQLVSPALTYEGYQPEAKGYSAKLIGTAETTAHERLQKQFSETGITSGTIYVSALVNFTQAPVGDVYFMTICQRGAKADNGIVDTKAGSEIARLTGCTDADGNTCIGLSKNAASAQAKSSAIELGRTYLLILKYEFVDGTNNDNVSLWINPAKTDGATAATLTADSSKSDASASMGLQGITLRQGSTSTSKIGPEVLIDAIRVATTWDELWGGEGGEDPNPPVTGDAAINAPASIDFGSLYQYTTTEATVNIKATGLTGDITVASTASDVKPAVASIPMADAMSDGGYDLTVTYKANNTTLDGQIILSAAGATNDTIALQATVYGVTPFANFRQVSGFDPEKVYYFQGRATVTHVDKPGNRLFAQDIYGGGTVISTEFANNPDCLKQGDRFTGAYFLPGELSQGVRPLYLIDTPAPSVTSTDVAVEPLEITFGELARDPETYVNRLVKVLDVDFGAAAGNKFSTSGTAVTSGSDSGRVFAFASTDLSGTEIPAKAKSVTGISTSAQAAVVGARSLADIEADTTSTGDEAAIEVERVMLIDANEYQEIGKTVEFGRLNIRCNALTKDAMIWLGGKDRAMFAIDTETIPADTDSISVLITYTPTTTGIHTATVNIDATPVELSQSIAISAKAYDPDNLPVITVDASSLTEFDTAVGTTQEQTVSYTTKALLDYGSIKVTNSGAFIISSATMLKNGTGSLRITFKPTAAGTYNDTIVFSADKAEPVLVAVKGTATGSAPTEEKQGDELTMASFDTTDAKALLIEDFQSMNARSNQPFHIDGWTNNALTGTRSWWAYNELNTDNWTAKVTAYDSKATEDTDAQMLLITPCLDFVGAKEQLLTFRIMGKLMTDGMTDNLQVIYIDPTTDTQETLKPMAVRESSPLDNVWMEEIGGLNIPASKDLNDQWIDYVIDLNGLEIADKFFIGFGYTSVRGTSTTTSYLIDDFSWGRDDIAFIRPSMRWFDMETTAGIEAKQEGIAIAGLNLKGDITVSMTGANASKFTVEPSTLPAEGGNITVRFLSDEIGVHQAYVSLKADGAPESLISIEANNKQTTGIEDVITDSTDNTPVDVYNLQGIRIRTDVLPSEALRGLPAGIYIVGGKKVSVR